jgi:hypothetical protein
MKGQGAVRKTYISGADPFPRFIDDAFTEQV